MRSSGQNNRTAGDNEVCVLTVIHPLEVLRGAMQDVKDTFVKGIDCGYVQDIAFIGNASGSYVWIPCQIIDLDVCLFVRRMDRQLGLWLSRIRQQLFTEMKLRGIDFDLRIIRGPYKAAVVSIERPILVAHVSLFTEESYWEQRALLRWAWRKYSCVVDAGRLARLASLRPTKDELLHGRGGVTEKLELVKAGSAPMLENLLPELTEFGWTVRLGEPLFAEYCLAAGAICSRNHARVLAKEEGDSMGNHEFLTWYDENVLRSTALRQLMALKERVRNDGYKEALWLAPKLAFVYLRELSDHLHSERPLGVEDVARLNFDHRKSNYL